LGVISANTSNVAKGSAAFINVGSGHKIGDASTFNFSRIVEISRKFVNGFKTLCACFFETQIVIHLGFGER